MKALIVNCGIGGQGKSASVKYVYHILDKIYGHTPWHYELLDDKKDIRALFTIKGVKIGIESYGDKVDRMGESMDLFVDEGCGIIVATCRTKSETKEKITDLEEHQGYTIIWTHSPRTLAKEYQDLFNKEWARHIVEMIMLLVTKEEANGGA